MATKLKNLKITSTDLVDQGANPDAHICLFKSAQPPDLPCKEVKEASEGELDLLLEEEPELNETEEDSMKKGLEKEMTPEDKKAFEDLAKRYGMEVTEKEVVVTVEKKVEVETPVEKGADALLLEKNYQENVAKMAELEKELGSAKEEMASMKKSLVLKELEELAAPYEMLGKKKEELAQTLYKMRDSGEEVFSEYKKSLDEQLALVGKSNMFNEVGSSNSGSGSVEKNLDGKVAEIQKRDGIPRAEAMVKAYEENPEMALEYEKNYGTGGM